MTSMKKVKAHVSTITHGYTLESRKDLFCRLLKLGVDIIQMQTLVNQFPIYIALKFSNVLLKFVGDILEFISAILVL